MSNDSVYTRTRALEWNPDNKGGGEADPIPSDLYVEQWVNVIGQSVRVEKIDAHWERYPCSHKSIISVRICQS